MDEGERAAMTKTISCREVGLFTDCDEVMRGDTDDEVMRTAASATG